VLVTETLRTEASGGLLTADGTRRRTPGGTCFRVVRHQGSTQERAQLLPYQAAKPAPQQPQPARPDAAPLLLTLALWQGLTPRTVAATVKLVRRDLPETRERHGLVSMAFPNAPRGLPKGITLASGPLSLSAPVQQWHAAVTTAEQRRTGGTPALLMVEAHVSTMAGALVGVVKGGQVVEGKAPVQSPACTRLTGLQRAWYAWTPHQNA
jgi:hypothetical protein